MLVRSVIIDNEMQVQFGWRFGIDLVQEANELLMSMPRHAITDHSDRWPTLRVGFLFFR